MVTLGKHIGTQKSNVGFCLMILIFLLLSVHLYFLIELIGMTLVHKTIPVSCTTQQNICTLHHASTTQSLYVPIYPPFAHLHMHPPLSRQVFLTEFMGELGEGL